MTHLLPFFWRSRFDVAPLQGKFGTWRSRTRSSKKIESRIDHSGKTINSSRCRDDGQALVKQFSKHEDEDRLVLYERELPSRQKKNTHK